MTIAVVEKLKFELKLELKKNNLFFHYSIDILISRAVKTLASAQKKGFTFTLRVSKKLIESNYRLAFLTCFILVQRINKKKIQPSLLREYNNLRNEYFQTLENSVELRQRRFITQGSTYHLEELLAHVVSIQGLLFSTINGISWSPKFSTRRIGYYLEKEDVIIISKTLDHPLVPQHVVEFVIYHELLHKLLGSKITSSRKIVHGKKFIEMEKKFYNFEKSNEWLKKIYPKIVKKITK